MGLKEDEVVAVVVVVDDAAAAAATEPFTGEDLEVVERRPSEEIRRFGSRKPPADRK